MPPPAVVSSHSSTTRPQPATYGGAPLRRVYTDATASDATADDLDGAGRVVGNWLTSGGKHIVTLGTKLSLMMGRGPNKPLRTLLKSLQCSLCAKPYFGAKDTLPSYDASVDFVLRELFIRSRSCAFCGATRSFKMTSATKASKAAEAFTTILSGSNCSSQYIAILFITALASLIPDLPALFIKHNTTRALALLQSRVTEQPDDAVDFLLAPSHRALAVLSELEIHSISKDILTITDRVRYAETWDSFKDLTRQRALLYDMLPPFFNSRETDIFISVLFCAGTDGRERDFSSLALNQWPIDAFFEEHWTDKSPLEYDKLAQHLTHSKDPVLNSMLPALLLALRDNWTAYLRVRIPYDSGKSRTPRSILLRTLDILQSPDWERLLRSWYGLIDRHNEEFMHYAAELLDVDSDSGEDNTSLGEDTEGEDDERMYAYSSETQMEEDCTISAITLAGSCDDNSVDDNYVSALSAFEDDSADADGGEII